MLRIIIVLLIHGLILIPLQWYVISSIRKTVFPRAAPLSTRRRIYGIAALIAANYVLLCLTILGAPYASPDFPGRQFLAVAYFGYLVLVAALGMVLVSVRVLGGLLALPDRYFPPSRQSHPAGRVVERDRCSMNKGFCGADERGGIVREPRRPQKDAGNDLPVRVDGQRPRTDGDISRRSFLRWAGYTGTAAAVGGTGYSLGEAFESPVINEYELSHPSLQGLRRPFTIVQVSDLHYSWFFGPAQLERLVHRLNSLEADAVVFTGDVFHSGFTGLESAEPILRKLIDRRGGNFVIMGNHERYVRTERSLASFRRSDLTHLGNRWISFQDHGAAIHLGGLDDLLVEWPPTPASPVFRRLMGRALSAPGMRVLLCHRPSILPLSAYGKIDLVLAGHTHGGQLIVPWPGRAKGRSAAGLFSFYTHGWYRKFQCRMYVNRGAGLVFFPCRINCPPEIAVFHLTAPTGDEAGASLSEPRRVSRIS